MNDEQEQGDAGEEKGGEDEREDLLTLRRFVGEVGREIDDEEQFEWFGGLQINSAKSQPEMRFYAERICAENEREGGEN